MLSHLQRPFNNAHASLRVALGSAPSNAPAIQAIRFLIAGGASTLLTAGLYLLAAVVLEIAPIRANFLAYMVGISVGYGLHSRWSFKAGCMSRNLGRAGPRFVAVCLVNLVLNSGWVWLLTNRLGLATWTPLVPMFFITPPISFILNRTWTFHSVAPV